MFIALLNVLRVTVCIRNLGGKLRGGRFVSWKYQWSHVFATFYIVFRRHIYCIKCTAKLQSCWCTEMLRFHVHVSAANNVHAQYWCQLDWTNKMIFPRLNGWTVILKVVCWILQIHWNFIHKVYSPKMDFVGLDPRWTIGPKVHFFQI